jgi:hypothetical protein
MDSLLSQWTNSDIAIPNAVTVELQGNITFTIHGKPGEFLELALGN